MRTFCLLFIFLQAFYSCGQTAAALHKPITDTLQLRLGNDLVPVHKSLYGNAPAPFFLHLHHNEQTADSAARFFLERNGGIILSIQNSRKRFLQFAFRDTLFLFDPNRMFTPAGAEQSLKLLGPFHPEALSQVSQFSDSLLQLLPDSLPVITVHNNTNAAYSIRSYMPGKELANEAAAVFHNAKMDEDDFVLTTDTLLYSALRKRKINVVLQNNSKALDDGSLGFLFGKMNRSYTNIEAEHGHFQQQLELMEQVVTVLFKQNKYN